MNKSEIEFAAEQREKLVEILDSFPYDLKDYAANNEVFMVDDHIELAEHLIANNVAPMVHAKWILESYAEGWSCSRCKGEMLYEVKTYGGGMYHDIENIFPPYCPHCGAQMDGDSNG